MVRPAIAAALCLVASSALAGWSTFAVPGDVREVQMQERDGGVFLAVAWAGTDAGAEAWQVLPDGGRTSLALIRTPNVRTAALRPKGCLVVASSAGSATSLSLSALCQGGARTVLFDSVPNNAPLHLESLSNGALWLLSNRNGNTFDVLRAGPSQGEGDRATSGWDGGNHAGTVAGALPFAGYAGSNLEATIYSSQTNLSIATNSGTSSVSFYTAPASDLAIAEDSNGTPTLWALESPTNVLQKFQDLSPNQPAPAALNTSGSTGNTSFDFVSGYGSAFGRGFGLLNASNGQFGPVPNPAAVGVQWVPRSAAPPFLSATRTSCAGPMGCVISRPVNDGGPNVAVYLNRFAPTFMAQAPTMVTAGTPFEVSITPSDPDGDPIWATWSAPAAWNAQSIDGGLFSRRFTPPAGFVCGETMDLKVVLSDGWAEHDTDGGIRVTATGSPLPPSISPVSSMTRADGAPLVFSVDAGTVCTSGVELRFDGGTFFVDGGTVTFVPPRTQCTAPSTASFTAVSRFGLDASTPTVATITIGEWGPPNTPVFPSSVVTQLAGTSATYAPDGSVPHECEGQGNFPGVTRSWAFDAGAPGVVVSVNLQNELMVNATASPCTSASIFAVVTVASGSGPMPAASLNVNVVPNVPAIDMNTAFSLGPVAFDAANSRASGSLSLGAACAAQQNLRARVEIFRDGNAVGQGTFAYPGDGGTGWPWSVAVAGGCGGGDYLVRATLLDASGQATNAPQPTQMFTGPKVDAVLGPLITEELPVSCEGGVKGQVRILPADGGCQQQAYKWSQSGGPLLEQGVWSGEAIDVASAPGTLDGFAGQTITFTVSADNGAGSVASASRSIKLTPTPFVALTHRTDSVAPREEEVLGVEVLAANQSACAVSGVEIVEALGRLVLQPGSVRVDGRAADAELDGEILRIRNVELGANSTAKITYRVRVPLLGAANPTALARYRDTDVTLASSGLERPGAPGCGCTATDAPFAAVALALALVRARRRSK